MGKLKKNKNKKKRQHKLLLKKNTYACNRKRIRGNIHKEGWWANPLPSLSLSSKAFNKIANIKSYIIKK